MDRPIETRIANTTTAVIWLSTLACGLSLAVSVAVVVSGGLDPLKLFAEILSEFDFPDADKAPTVAAAPAWQGILVGLLWMIPDLWGCYLFLRVRQLFVRIRKAGVFQYDTARRVRQVGWALTLLAGILLVFEALTAAALSHFAYDDGLSLEFSIEDTHLYCVVIGLVILALGSVMVDATRLSEENRAFV